MTPVCIKWIDKRTKKETSYSAQTASKISPGNIFNIKKRDNTGQNAKIDAASM